MSIAFIESNWREADAGKLPYGWARELSYPNVQGFDAHYQLYKDMVQWLERNVKNYQQNTRWIKIGDCIYVQFRKSKDMAWFALRFGI